jgi:hypothetical protein
MDAYAPLRRFIAGLLSGLLAGMTGCTWPPVGRPPAPAPSPKEPPIVVQDERTVPTSQPTAGFEQRVLNYVAAIDGLPQRSTNTAHEVRPANAARQAAPIELANGPAQPATPPSLASAASDQPDSVKSECAATIPPTSPEAGAGASEARAADAESAAVIEPPELSQVVVRAGEAKAGSPGGSASAELSVNAPAKAAGHVALREIVAQLAAQAPDTSFREQLDARMLLVLAGEYERAREPLALVPHEQQELTSGLIETLIALRENQADGGGTATATLHRLEQLADKLRPASDLGISRLVICREVRGFGQYQPIEPPVFPAGAAAEFVLYCEVRDFQSQAQADGQFVSRFSLKTLILNRAGDVVNQVSDPELTDRCRNRRRDCFIPRLVRLPATLSPGEYVAKVSLADKLGGQVAEQRVAFRVAAGR